MMMYYTCTSSLTCTILLFAFFYLIRKKGYFSNASEPRIFIFLYGISILRLLLPLNLEISKGIPCKGAYSWLFGLLVIEKIKIFEINVSAAAILITGIAAISSIKILNFMGTYYKVVQEIKAYEFYEIQQQMPVINKVRKIYPNFPDAK